MADIKFYILQASDTTMFEHIADWYLSEWKIPKEKTLLKLKTVTSSDAQFQVLMTVDGIPVSTGGIYDHVGLLDKEPRFKIYKNWLALVYTIPDKRGHGYGAMICEYIQDHSKQSGMGTLHLFTDTAERLYKRLGWEELERLELGERKIVVMKKE